MVWTLNQGALGATCIDLKCNLCDVTFISLLKHEHVAKKSKCVCVGYGGRVQCVCEAGVQEPKDRRNWRRRAARIFNETSPPHTLSITSDNLFFFLILMFFPYICRICFFLLFVLSKYPSHLSTLLSLLSLSFCEILDPRSQQKAAYIYIYIFPAGWIHLPGQSHHFLFYEFVLD